MVTFKLADEDIEWLKSLNKGDLVLVHYYNGIEFFCRVSDANENVIRVGERDYLRKNGVHLTKELVQIIRPDFEKSLVLSTTVRFY